MIHPLSPALRRITRTPLASAEAALILSVLVGGCAIGVCTLYQFQSTSESMAAPASLVSIWVTPANCAECLLKPTPLTARSWRERPGSPFRSLAAYAIEGMYLDGSAATPITLGVVDGPLFQTLGLHLKSGREFIPETTRAAPPSEAVVSLSFWRRVYGTDRKPLNALITIGDIAYTVIGVLPRAPGAIGGVDIWVPALTLPARSRPTTFRVVARLPDGEALAAARREAAWLVPLNQGMRTEVTEFDEATGIRRSRERLNIVVGALAVAFLIGCTNLATLFLARTLDRAGELNVRASLGATRMRLGTDVLTEIAITCGLGSGIAILLLTLVSRQVAGWMQASLGIPLALSVRQMSVTFAVLGLLAAVLIAAPSIAFVTRIRESLLLRDGALASSASRPHKRVQAAMLALQIGLSVVLLAGAAMLSRSVSNVAAFDIGFDPDSVLEGTVDFSRPGSPRQLDYSNAQVLLSQVAYAFPPTAVAAWHQTAVSRHDGEAAFTRADLGEVSTRPSWPPSLPIVSVDVSPDYFQVLGLRIVAGRAFTDRVGSSATPVVVISQLAARHLWPRGGALGRRVKLGPADANTRWMTVIGIVQNAAVPTVGGFFFAVSARQHASPLMYRPLSQAQSVPVRTDGPVTGDVHFLVRYPPSTEAAALGRLDSVLASHAGGRHWSRAKSLSAQMLAAEPFRRLRAIAEMLQFLAIFGLGLVVIGFVAHTVEAVVREKRELAIRAALGSSPIRLLVHVLHRSVLIALVGVTLGFMGLLVLRGMLSPVLDGTASIIQTGLLYGLNSSDALSYVIAVAAGLAIAIVAATVPAARFAWSDPARALR